MQPQHQFNTVEMAAPRLCAPDEPHYAPLNKEGFWDHEIHVFPETPLAYARIKYRNEDGQRFDIYVQAANSSEGRERIWQYVNEAMVCVEAVENRMLETFQIESTAATQSIVQPEVLTLIVETEEFIGQNGIVSYLARTPSLMIDVVMAGPDLDPEAEPPRYFSQLQGFKERFILGIATPQEIKTVAEFALTQFAQFQEVTERGETYRVYGADDRSFVEWFVLEFAPRQAMTLHFAMDPKIGPASTGKVHFYRTFCTKPQKQPSARVGVKVDLNTVNVTLTEDQSNQISGPIPIVQGEGLRWLSPLPRQASGLFRTSVTVGDMDAMYSISQGWIQEGTCW